MQFPSDGFALSHTIGETEFVLTDTLPSASKEDGTDHTMSNNYKKDPHSLASLSHDIALVIPGITEDTAIELSKATGMTITAGAQDSALPTDKAETLSAIDAIKNSTTSYPAGTTPVECAESLEQIRNAWELKRDALIQEATDRAGEDHDALATEVQKVAQVLALEEAKMSLKYEAAVRRELNHGGRDHMRSRRQGDPQGTTGR